MKFHSILVPDPPVRTIQFLKVFHQNPSFHLRNEISVYILHILCQWQENQTPGFEISVLHKISSDFQLSCSEELDILYRRISSFRFLLPRSTFLTWRTWHLLLNDFILFSNQFFSIQRSSSEGLDIFYLKTSSHSDFVWPMVCLVHKVSAPCKYNIFR